MKQIEVMVDTNAWVDMVRKYPSLDRAMAAGAGKLLQAVIAHGERLGLRLHAGPHVLDALETVLVKTLAKAGGTNWSPVDALKWRRLCEQACRATGGRVDVTSDLTMQEAFRYVHKMDVPDEEDAHVLRLAELVKAHYVVTNDRAFAQAKTTLRFCTLEVLDMQIANTVRRLGA